MRARRRRMGIPPFRVRRRSMKGRPTCRSSGRSAESRARSQPARRRRATLPSWAYRFRRASVSPIRIPYGGFTAINPGGSALGRAEIGWTTNSTSLADPGAQRVGTGRCNRSVVAIATRNGHGSEGTLARACLGEENGPAGCLRARPSQEGEGAISARRHPPGDQGGFDRDRPCPAHRVDERNVAVPPAGEEDGGGQRFPERGLGQLLPVAAQVQQGPGRIGAHRAYVMQEAHDELLIVRRRVGFFGVGDAGRPVHPRPRRRGA